MDYLFGHLLSTQRTIVPPVSGSSYEEVVLSLSPTAYWRLGESSGNLADISGNAHTLTATGLTYSVSGWAGDGDTACTWGGSGDYATVADHADWDVGTNDFSISWCMKANGLPASEQAILGHDLQGFTGEWGFFFIADGSIRISLNAGATHSLAVSVNLFDDAWHHCVLTLDRSGLATIYADGTSVGTVDISAKVATDLTNARALWLGARDTTQYNFVGSLDEVVFWKTRLITPSEVEALYDARYGTGEPPTGDAYDTAVLALSPVLYYRMQEASGSVMDDASTTGHDGSYVGSPTLGVAGPFTGTTGVTFNGTSQWAQASHNAVMNRGTGDLSIAMFVKMPVTWVASQYLIGHHGDGDVGSWELSTQAEDKLKSRLNGDTTYYLSNATTSWNDDGWHLVVLSLDRDGNGQMWIDNTSQGTQSISAASAIALDLTATLYIARRNSAGYFTGSLSHVAVFASALTSGDVSTLWTAAGH